MKKKKERIIYLNELVLYIIKQWKTLALIIICIGVIFGILGLYKVNMKYNSDENKNDKIEVKVSGNDLMNVDTVLQYERAIESQKEYNSNSILMKINPMDKKVAYVRYQLMLLSKSDIESYEGRLEQAMKAYQDVTSTESFYKFIIEGLSLDSDIQYIKEIISSNTDFSGIVTFSVMAPTETMAKQTCELIKQYLEIYNEEILKNYNDIKAVIDYEGFVTEADIELQNNQITQYSNLQNMQTSLNNRKALLSENAKTYLKLAREAMENGEYQSGQTLYKEVASHTDISASRKMYEAGIYTLKRIVLAICLFVVFFSFVYMFSPKLMCANDIYDIYGVKVFGVLTQKNSDTISIIAEKLINCIKTDDILLISSKSNIEDDDIINRIQTVLHEKKISVNVLSNTNSEKSLKTLKHYNNIIIVEYLKQSTYSDIDLLVDDIHCIGKEIVGAVVINN